LPLERLLNVLAFFVLSINVITAWYDFNHRSVLAGLTGGRFVIYVN